MAKKEKEKKTKKLKKEKPAKKSKKVVEKAQPWLDRVCPSALEIRRDSFVLEQAFCTVYSIFNYPSEVGLRWLRPITLMENTMVCIFNEEGNRAELIETLNFSIREEQIRQAENINKQITQAVDAESKITKSLELSQRIQADNVNVAAITINIMVYADSEAELKTRCRDLEGKLSGRGFTARRYPFDLQEAGFDSFLPICNNKYKQYTALDMPVDVFWGGLGVIPSHGINDPTGIYLGFDASGNPIFLDIWSFSNQKTNHNLAILGKSGSGKSATTKTLMMHELAMGTKIFCLDPEVEYLAIAEAVHGNVIDAAGGLNPDGKKCMINPLQLTDFPDAWDDMTDEQIKANAADMNYQGSISKKIQALKGWFKIYQPELTMAHISLLEMALYETYRRKGCTEISDPRKMRNNEHPTMSDLGKVLVEYQDRAEEGTQEKKLYGEILIYLNSAINGSDRFLFNGYTNVNLNNKFNVFNVHDLLNAPDNIKNAQFSNITSYIWLAITKDRNEKAILDVDEAHLFINENSTTTFEFLGQVCKRVRKYSSSLWVTTQNISDFLHPSVARYGEGILNNCSIRFLMKSDASDLEKLVSLFALNDGECNLIKVAPRGHGLLMAGDMRVFASVEIEPGVIKLCQAGGGK